MTLDWNAVLLVPLMLGLAILLYYLFFKIYEKSILKKDQEKAVAKAKEIYVLEDLDLDF